MGANPQNYQAGQKVQYGPDGEGPTRQVILKEFWMDLHAVSNAEFKLFVDSTGYVTEAENFGDSFVTWFSMSQEAREKIEKVVENAPWFTVAKGADWRHPFGPDSDLEGLMEHPVTHVSWNDARMYCAWQGKRLPTEAEWEGTCRGGLVDKKYPWGDTDVPEDGIHRMNVWQGEFRPEKIENSLEDGWTNTCPVTEYKPQNAHGVRGMVGNTWEWVSDYWTTQHSGDKQFNPQGPTNVNSKQRTMKGGSYSDHGPSGHDRYRCSARTANGADSTASNLSFRCAADRLPTHLKKSNTPPPQYTKPAEAKTESAETKEEEASENKEEL